MAFGCVRVLERRERGSSHRVIAKVLGPMWTNRACNFLMWSCWRGVCLYIYMYLEGEGEGEGEKA